MPTLKSPIVGMQFRPPAALLLRQLPINHPLFLEPEPSNEHDPNAIKVMIDLETLDPDNEQISQILSQVNLTSEASLADFVNKHSLHLGYIARSSNPRSCIIDGKPCSGNAEIISALGHKGRDAFSWKHPAALTFSMSGQSLVEVIIV